MSIQALAAVFDLNPDLALPASVPAASRGGLKMLLLTLADESRDNDTWGDAFPSVSRLSRASWMSESTVQRGLKTLVQLRLIEVQDPSTSVVGVKIKNPLRRPKVYRLARERLLIIAQHSRDLNDRLAGRNGRPSVSEPELIADARALLARDLAFLDAADPVDNSAETGCHGETGYHGDLNRVSPCTKPGVTVTPDPLSTNQEELTAPVSARRRRRPGGAPRPPVVVADSADVDDRPECEGCGSVFPAGVSAPPDGVCRRCRERHGERSAPRTATFTPTPV
ncbi:hypothetical protein CJ179_50285 [Rhodococcus sp. ACS1]|uniref:helix-turn-helix domain-containing protein n=1 Tax=Rhodococcus sp. ACS1 TaxID=2028570 RepID=UPI000BB10D8E|nr:helix-turn-helix domain-containing protein [Rhodococcus sp. ACS1]PBC35029.1 hypothetical protein CJ179_50285 [Rhodococcus sp. ACS1]